MGIYEEAGITRPSQLIEDVLMGRMPYADADQATKSVVGLEFNRAAREVLSAPTNAEKRTRLDRVPSYAKTYVEKEIRKMLKNDIGKAA